MDKKVPKILFIHIGENSFVREDLKILEAICNVKKFHFDAQASNKLFAFVLLLVTALRQTIWLLYHIHSTNIIYCWFADYHGFLPALFAKICKKPIVTVLGGFDSNKIASLNYGLYVSYWRRPLGTYVIKNSTLLLPVDETLIQTNERSVNWPEAHPNGITHNVKSFNTPYLTIPTGYDPEVWKMGPENRSEIATTVYLGDKKRSFYLKGIDLILKTSHLLPGVEFWIVGISDSVKEDVIKEFNPGPNVTFYTKMPREHLNSIYQQSSVYLQLSRAEGLPNVLCEAMMCGCIPVGSPVFGIPNAIGDTGFIVEYPDPALVAETIKKALDCPVNMRSETRNRIIKKFDLTFRRQKLQKVIQDLVNNN